MCDTEREEWQSALDEMTEMERAHYDDDREV